MGGQEQGGRSAGRVVAVVLAVAVGIILASLATTVALEMGQDRTRGVAAGAGADFLADEDRIRVVFTAMERSGTTLEATVYNVSNGSAAGTLYLTQVGNAATMDLTDGWQYRVVVVASYQQRREVVLVERDTL